MSDELNIEENEESQEDLLAALQKDLVENPFTIEEDKLDSLIPTATLEIYNFIAGYLERKEPGTVNRASSATMCVKRRWYQHRGYQASPLTPRKSINFLLGDLTERCLAYFISEACVGPGKLYSEIDHGEIIGSIHFQGKELKIYKQKELKIKINNDLIITGHCDGMGKRNSDGQWELLEYKSSSNYGFDSFKRDGAKDYLKQAHALGMSDLAKERNVQSVRFFFLRKETGNCWDRLELFHPAINAVVRNEFLAVLGPEMEAPFKLKVETEGRGKKKTETGRYIAEFPCSFCSYLLYCKGPHDIEFKKTQGGGLKPVYIFNHKDV